MSDKTPSIDFVDSYTHPSQWGVGFFFRQDGRKKSLNTRRAAFALGTVFLSLLCLQLLLDTPSPSKDARTSASTTNLSKTEIIEVPSISPKREEDATKKVRSSPRSKANVQLLGPEIISRPRDITRILPGTYASAVLVGGASNGVVRASLRESISVEGETIYEAGTILVGTGTSTEERLLIKFSKAILKSGSVEDINADACDEKDKILGIKGTKIGEKALNAAGSIGLGFIGGMAEGLQETHGEYGATIKNPTVKNALLSATANTAIEQSRNLMSDLKTAKITIEANEGLLIGIIFGGSP